MGCMEKKNTFIRKSAEVFIYFSPSHVRILLEVGALSIKCMVKHCVFRKRAAALFALKDDKVIRGGALSIKCKSILCFSKERRGAYSCPTYIEGGVLSIIYGLDSICRFYYICFPTEHLGVHKNSLKH